MTDEELENLFPNVKWPQTFEGKDGTYIKPAHPPKLSPGFSDHPTTKDTMSRGSLTSRPSTLRDRFMVDFLGGIYGDDTEARDRINNLMVFADFFGSPLFGAHDTPLAIDEGRYKDAAISGITAAVPFLGKPAKFLDDAIRRRLAVDELIDNLPNSNLPEPARNLGPTIADDDIGLTVGVKSPPVRQFLPEGSMIRKTEGDEIFDPPEVPQRHISEDYKNDIETYPDGRLKKDMDGRKLIAKNIIGRQTEDGPDIPGTPEMVQNTAEELLGKKIETVSPNEIDGDLGVTEFIIPPGTPTSMKISNRLMGDQRDRVVGHETTHIFDEMAGQIPANGHEEKLRFIHNTTATGKEGVAPKIPLEKLYDAENVPRELMAEAIRTYIINPNWLKTVAPEVAALIRKHINEHPILSKIIQFNSLAAGIGGASLVGQSEESSAREALPGSLMSPNALKTAHSLFGPPIPFELVSSTTKAASGLAKIASALTQRDLPPQAPKFGMLANIARTLLNIDGRKKPSPYGPR